MAKLDSFTGARLVREARAHRERTGTLPTLQDFEKAGFSKDLVDAAVREEKLVELYVTLTSGAVMKGYKAK